MSTVDRRGGSFQYSFVPNARRVFELVQYIAAMVIGDRLDTVDLSRIGQLLVAERVVVFPTLLELAQSLRRGDSHPEAHRELFLVFHVRTSGSISLRLGRRQFSRHLV